MAEITSAENAMGGETSIPETKLGTEVDTSTTEKTDVTHGEENKTSPYKVFTSKEDFDRHSLGILNNAKYKAEKELLALLGLKPDEKNKLAKFKEAYDSTLSESEKQAKSIEALTGENETLKNELAEKEAIILALSKINKDAGDVSKFVKMAKGLVDENTTMDVALEQVMAMFKPKEEAKPTVPSGKPISNVNTPSVENNPFKTGNMTEQGKLIKSDRERAREMYFAVYGRAPSW